MMRVLRDVKYTAYILTIHVKHRSPVYTYLNLPLRCYYT